MKSVNVKEARLFQQWLNTTIASTTWKDLINFINTELPAITEAWKKLDESELYNTVWNNIEKKANEIVENKCKPEWDRIAEEMKTLWEKRNELAKQKASWNWTDNDEGKITELDKKISDLSNEAQKITDNANKKLEEYKDKLIDESEWAAFFLEDDEYEIIKKLSWF